MEYRMREMCYSMMTNGIQDEGNVFQDDLKCAGRQSFHWGESCGSIEIKLPCLTVERKLYSTLMEAVVAALVFVPPRWPSG